MYVCVKSDDRIKTFLCYTYIHTYIHTYIGGNKIEFAAS